MTRTSNFRHAGISACLIVIALSPTTAAARTAPFALEGTKLAAPLAAVGSQSGTRAAQREQGKQINAKIDEIRRLVPSGGLIMMAEREALADAQKQIADYRSRMDIAITPAHIRIANDRSNKYAIRAAERADRFATSLARGMTTLDIERIKSGDYHGNMKIRYITFLFQIEHLKQFLRLYPDRPAIVAANQSANAILAQFGTPDEIQAQDDANYAARVARMRMFPARQNNPALERQFVAAFKASPFTRKDYSGAKVLKINLTSSGWSVTRNTVTGVPISRDQQANLALQTADGKCHHYLVLFEQKHQGGGRYGGSSMRSGSDHEMLCENV